MWGSVTLIPDEITKAANGQIVLTAVMLYATKLLRAGGFHKQESNHSVSDGTPQSRNRDSALYRHP